MQVTVQRCYRVSPHMMLLARTIQLTAAYTAVGIYLTGVARRAAEWPQGAINPSPLIIMACTLIQYNKAQSRVCGHVTSYSDY